MHSLRRGDYARGAPRQVQGATSREALDHVCEAIKATDRPDLRLDQSGKTALVILRQTRGYKKHEPPTKHQKALPPRVYCHILRTARTQLAREKAHLLCGAFFFAYLSCEYSTVNGACMTDTIRVTNVCFFNGKRDLRHDNPFLHLAENVSVKFQSQKNGEKDEIVTMHRTTDALLNPAIHWAFTVRRVHSIPGFAEDYTVDSFSERSVVRRITSKEIEGLIKNAVRAIGKAVLGFGEKDVGTHSNRLAAAMVMYLAKVPVFTIMRIGR